MAKIADYNSAQKLSWDLGKVYPFLSDCIVCLLAPMASSGTPLGRSYRTLPDQLLYVLPSFSHLCLGFPVVLNLSILLGNAAITCEIKLSQHYFRLHIDVRLK